MIVRNALAALGFLSIAAAAAVGLNAYGGDVFGNASPPRLSVSFRGLDLTTREGLDELDRRIEWAIAEVCTTVDPASLPARRLDARCRAKAWDGVRPQIDRAIDRQRSRQGAVSVAGNSIFDDLAGQPYIIRKTIGTAMGRAFESGITDNWYTLGAKGLVYAAPAYLDRGATCRFVTVTRKSHGQQEVLTRGPVCRSAYGVLEAPSP